MPHDVDARLPMTAELVEVDLGYGDQMQRHRRIDGLRRRFMTVWLAFSKETAVDHETAAAFTREVLAVLDEHGGSYDGWSGFLVNR